VKTEGKLAEQDVPDLVRELGRQRWTGRLQLERPRERIGMSVEEGRFMFASSSDPDYRLGPRLLRRGAISLRQLEDAGHAMSSGKRLGTVLVERGLLQPKELVQGVLDQTRDIILHAFHWTDGAYRLEAGASPGETITLKMSTPQLVLDGVSQIEAWSRVERGCGGLAARYAPVPGTDALFKQLTLDVDQAALLKAVKEPRDVESLCAESVLNDFEVCRNLWAFRVIGLVRKIEETTPLDEDGLEYVLPADDDA
jgi:hypothetical protein